MNRLPTERLGRATFQHIASRRAVCPTERELRWMKHLERHGPQSSELLYERTRDTHRSKDQALRDLQKLRAGGYLTLPKQQRATERAEFNPYVYDLTRQAKDHLSGLGVAEPTIRPVGHWWHAYIVSAVTGSLDILSTRRGHTFIPAHTILARTAADVPIPVGAQRLIPDQVFAIRYPEGYRAFLWEVDRGTEPFQSSAARKSLARSIDLYTKMLETDAHRRHYGLNATTLVLWVFSNPVRLARFQALVDSRAGKHAGRFLSKVLPEQPTWKSLCQMHETPWASGAGEIVAGL